MAMAPTGYDGTLPRADDATRPVAGMTVYDREGARIGTVADVGRGHFLIEDGLLRITRTYLPRTIVERTTGDGVYLAVSQREAMSLAREFPPDAGDAWYGPHSSGMAVVGVRLLEIPLREQALVTQVTPLVVREVHLRKQIGRRIERVAVAVQYQEAHVESDAREHVHIAAKPVL